MNMKEFVNSMKTEEDKEWANRVIEMALSLRQQKTLRASYSRERNEYIDATSNPTRKFADEYFYSV